MWKDLKFDSRQLIGGRQFLVPVELARNGLFIKTLAHIDGGANIFGIVKTSLAYQLSQRFGVKFIKLPQVITPTGYNGLAGEPIRYALLLTLTIDKRRINFPFLITSLGSNDVLIGRKFLEHYDLKQSYGRGKNQLEWPLDMPIIPYFEKRIFVDLSLPKRSLTAQEDADRRTSLMDAEDQTMLSSLQPPKARKASKRSGRASHFARDLKNSLARMESLLKGGPSPSEHSPSQAPKTTREPVPPVKSVGINLISACAISLLHHRFTENKKKAKLSGAPLADEYTFVSSIHDLDRELSRRDLEAREAVLRTEINSLSPEEALQAKYRSNDELIDAKLPPQYFEFRELFSREASDQIPEHRTNVDHKIELTAENNLTIEPLRRLTDDQLTEVKKYILENLHKGFIEASNSPQAAPILFAKKADGSLRLCVDYRKLNALTKKDPYPIPLIDEMMARISKAKIFTKIDIQQAFHRIRMSPESEELTTFRTRYGMYKYKVLPFGLTNGPATFQRFINDILLEHLDDFCSAYLDDILVYSGNKAEHEEHVRKVMRILQSHGLQADIKKSEFGVPKTKFLGFIIGVHGIEVDPEKTSVIDKWEYAENVRGVQSFLGFCNFYRRFIKDYSRICRPLTALTSKNVPFDFNDDCKNAWEALRRQLQNAPILCHYEPHRQTKLETDSSDGVVAGVLSQLRDDGFYHPVGFFSKTMADAELNYPIHDKELLAIFRSFKQYRTELLGAQKVVHVYTDHRALEYFMTTKDLSARQARWAEFFAEFHFTIMYRTGTTNTLADTLSRRDQDLTPLEARKRAIRSQQLLPASKLSPEVASDLQLARDADLTREPGARVESHKAIRAAATQLELLASVDYDYVDICDAAQLIPVNEEQETETILGEPSDPSSMIAYDVQGYNAIDDVLRANKESPLLEDQRNQARNNSLDYELSQGKLFFQGRLVVPLEPPELRTSLIRHVHEQPCVAHAGVGKTKLLVGRKYYWKNLGNDVATYIHNCRCARMKARRDRTPGFLNPLPVPERPYQHLTMDFTEVPLDEEGYDFALVIMDRLSKKPVALPCNRTINAKGLAELFLVHWIRHFGMPDSILSDRGAQFVSAFWKELCRILGTKVKLTTAYNPNVDGQTEVMNQYIKQRLRPFCSFYQDNWGRLLPLMDIAQLTLPHESLGRISPFEVLNGFQARSSFDLVNPEPPQSATERLNREDALRIASRAQEVVKFAQSSIATQQAKMKRLADQRRRPVDWKVGDEVMISTRNWKMDRPSRKLSDKWYGPVKVLEKVGESWRVQLPPNWSIYPVFHSHSLRKHTSNPLPGQIQEPPAPIQVLPDQDEWEIEEILGSRIRSRKLEYQIRWKGADEDLEWYPCSDAMTAPHVVQKFHLDHPTAKGPPKALLAWLKAYNDGVDDYRELEDNSVMTSTARTQFFERGG